MENTRHIPNNVQRQLKEKHFLECAWDGTRLTDQHHIEEYALGGKHTVENLILLCPNCHRQVHQGKITDAELKERQSTHFKGDRYAISLPFDAQEPIIKLGSATFDRTPILVQIGALPLLSYKVAPDKEILFSARMYNEDGDLILWMSDNRLCMPIGFDITIKGRGISIADTMDPNNYLKIWQEDSVLHIEGKTFLDGIPVIMENDSFTFGNFKVKELHAVHCQVGIHAPRSPTMERATASLDDMFNKSQWPYNKNTLIANATQKDGESEIAIIATLEGKFMIRIKHKNYIFTHITQAIIFPNNCQYNLRVEVYQRRIDVFINDILLLPNDSQLEQIHRVTCLDTSI